MSFRDVRKENMTGFWNILRVKIRSVPFFFKKRWGGGGKKGKKRNTKFSLHQCLKNSPRTAKDNTTAAFQGREGENAVTRKFQKGREQKFLSLPNLVFIDYNIAHTGIKCSTEPKTLEVTL